ncbi:MAG: aminomethyltransferase family protein [Kiloniellales bacterium]
MTANFLMETPFHARVAPLCLSGKWERWAGYTTVTYFYRVTDEYFAIRNAASLFDMSPMIKYRVTGRDAARFVNRLITREVDACPPGRGLYACWCNDDGKVIEDGTVFRLAEGEFQINTAEHNLCWFEDTALGLDVTIDDISEDLAALALQGPLSRRVLEQLGLAGIDRLPYFGLARFTLDDAPLLVSRTGFTGDLGYELWIEPGRAEMLWDGLMAAGEGHGLTPIGSAALEIARTEAGLIQIKIDYIGAEMALRESQKRSPYELGLGWSVNLKKPFFVGKRALVEEQRRGGPPRRLVGLEVVGNKPATGSFIYRGEVAVGRVTSAAWSPTLKKNIALATVEAAHATPEADLWADIWHPKELKIEKIKAPCRVVRRPFYDPPRRKGQAALPR